MRSAYCLRGFGTTPLRHCGNTLAPTPIRDYAPSLRSPWRAAEEIAIGFLDEASPQLTANTARVWHFGRGGIIKNTTRLKANAIGFYALAGESVQDFLPRSTQRPIAEFLAAIRAANPGYRAIIVILDNFSSHHAGEVAQAAQDNAIELVFLPPYAPDLNPIEFI